MQSKNKKSTNVIIRIIILILIVIFCYSGMKVLNWFQDNKENKNIQKEVNEIVKTPKKEGIDFKKLKKINSDTVAYLKVKNTNIDYVVVKGPDNDYYLSHNFKKRYNGAGWVFATYHNKFDGTDKNIVIFGHNMRDGSMFGTLKNILTKEWYNNKKNLTINLVTEKGTTKYKVFSVYQVEKEDYYITTDFNTDEEYSKFLNIIKKRSIKNFNVEITTKDKILTLSTCSMTGKERVVLHAKKM